MADKAEVAEAPQEQANALVIHRQIDAEGNVGVHVQCVGDVLPTESLAILAIALKHQRSVFGGD